MFADEIVFTNMNDSEVTERDKQYYNHGAEDLANTLIILSKMPYNTKLELFAGYEIEDMNDITCLFNKIGYDILVQKIKEYRSRSIEIANKLLAIVDEYGVYDVKRIAEDMSIRKNNDDKPYYILH